MNFLLLTLRCLSVSVVAVTFLAINSPLALTQEESIPIPTTSNTNFPTNYLIDRAKYYYQN